MRPFTALACLLLCAPAPRAQDTPAPGYVLSVERGSALELRAVWEPFRTSKWGLFEQLPALRTPVVARERASYDGAAFEAFLPDHPVALGEVWKVDDGAVLGFLRQFHAGVGLKGLDKGEAAGTYVCLRAVSESAFELLLRAHAVIQLEEDVVFKPAQFEGRLVLEREGGKLRAFQLELPVRDPNAGAVRRKTEHRATRADIGFVPRMELSSGAPPTLDWPEQIPDEEARQALRRAFYAFEALDWLPLDQAALRAREEQKPLHLIVLLGALDDDSC